MNFYISMHLPSPMWRKQLILAIDFCARRASTSSFSRILFKWISRQCEAGVLNRSRTLIWKWKSNDEKWTKVVGKLAHANVTTVKSSQFHMSLRYVKLAKMKPLASSLTSPSTVYMPVNVALYVLRQFLSLTEQFRKKRTEFCLKENFNLSVCHFI